MENAGSESEIRRIQYASDLLDCLAWKLQAYPTGRQFSEGFRRAARNLQKKADREKDGKDHDTGALP